MTSCDQYSLRVGDTGSGYVIAHQALRLALRDYEHNHLGTVEDHSDRNVLFNLILRQLRLNSIYELVSWSMVSNKTEVASLAPLILRQWENGNQVAAEVVNKATGDLSADIKCLINKLKGARKDEIKDGEVKIGFTGSLLSRNEAFAGAVIKKLREIGVTSEVVILKETVMGAMKGLTGATDVLSAENGDVNDLTSLNEEDLRKTILPIPTALAPTESRNERSMNLDTMPIGEAVDLMISEDAALPGRISKHKDQIEMLIRRVTDGFKSGGRLFYIGAGTSGRLGVLDASECPPTFQSPPHWVQGR